MPLPADPDTLLNLSEISLGPEIGHGAFSHVYKGSFQGHEVAVKKMKLVDRDGMKYLESELAMLKCVPHSGPGQPRASMNARGPPLAAAATAAAAASWCSCLRLQELQARPPDQVLRRRHRGEGRLHRHRVHGGRR